MNMRNTMKLVFLDTKTVGDVPNMELLAQFGTLSLYPTTTREQAWERIKDADIVITNKVVLDDGLIGRAARLKLICVAATGTNNIDRAAAEARGIPVKNVADYSSNSVAQGTFALLLHLLNRIPYYDGYVKSGAYAENDIFTHLGKPFWELGGKRFGIIGLGHIGRQVARIAGAFGAEVVYYSTSGRNNDQVYPQLVLEDLLHTSDVVSIHAPLNAHTENLINYGRLCLMKKNAILLNVGRGGIVNEEDLARALDEERIGGAGIDVFQQEPISPGHPFLHMANRERLVLTPHSIWASIEARTLLIARVAKNIGEFLYDQK
ncbi:D-2-hydroxyacid dehydrogenase [Parapedobacter koreensis]|uniref:Glycerate dehydrogenase n=1 Tax=Parapedobacter koreensis TaxID=332977 RepID=A0A1H7TE63_9SPHI|nr:D-2-hydroxyacid dehydrogenase [Parapedobacter koreensis]SEL83023.1 glycerate dehydrogenase [Parapedobacter koreensis]